MKGKWDFVLWQTQIHELPYRMLLCLPMSLVSYIHETYNTIDLALHLIATYIIHVNCRAYQVSTDSKLCGMYCLEGFDSLCRVT